MLATISYADEAEVREHVKEVVGHLKVIEAAGINNPQTVGGVGCDFPTIQEAIDSGADQVRIVAKANDEPYYENIAIFNQSVALKGNYASCGDAEADKTSDVKAVIDGSKNGRVIDIHKDDNLDPTQYNTISHLVIQNGNSDSDGGGGGDIRASNNNKLFAHLDHLVITGNSTDNNHGGGVYFYAIDKSSSNLYVTDSVIDANNADGFGAGLYVDGSTAKVLIDGETHITNNSASYGAGAYIDSSKLTAFSPVVFDQNKSTKDGAGLRGFNNATINIYGKKICEQGYCFGSDSQPVSFIDNIADSDNDDEGDGGGITMYKDGKTDVYNALFKGNQAYVGGAIDAYFGAEINVKASRFEQNSANLGIVAAVQGDLNEDTKLLIQDSVIANNGEGGNGEFIDGFLFYADVKANLSLNYNTIVDNEVISTLIYGTGDKVTTSVVSSIVDEDEELYFGFDGATLEAECLLVQNNSNLPDQEDIAKGDAMFADPDAGDYHLTADSPAIDFCIQTGDSETDKDGEIRGFDDIKKDQFGIYDLGAYEYLGSDIIFKDGFQKK